MGKIIQKKISTKITVCYIYIFTLFIPEFFKTAGGLWGYIYWVLEAIRIFGSLYYIARVVLKKRINNIFILCIVYNFVILLSTIVNKSELSVYRTYINAAIPSLGIIAFIETNKNKINVLKIFKRILEILITINFIYMLIHPNGVYIVTLYNAQNSSLSRDMMNYFLSGKNRLIMWMIPLSAVMEIERVEKKIGKLEYVSFLIMMLGSLIIAQSITSIAAIGLFYIGCICFEKNKFFRITIGKISVVYIVVTVLFIAFNIQNVFSKLIVGVLNKNLLLQGRVYIWEIALEMIKRKPILGYGNAGNGSIIQWYGYMWYAHNLALDILIQGGVVALSVMTLIIYRLTRLEKATLKSNKEKYGKVQIVNIALASFLLLGIFESFLNYPQFFMIIGLSGMFMNSRYIRIGGKKNEHNKKLYL